MLGQAGLRQIVRSGSIDLKAFRQVDDRRVFASLAFDYAIVLAAAATASWIHYAPITLLAIMIIAGRQSALQGLVHSACHFSLFSRRKHNETLEFLFAYPILDSVSVYRGQHLEHHRVFELQTPDRFDYLLESLQLSRRGCWARTWVVFLRPLLGHAGYRFLADAVGTYKANHLAAVRLAVYWGTLLAVLGFCGWLWQFFIYWIVPLVWLYPVFDIWAELSDHLGARGESRNQEGFFYSAFLKGHETYHAIHHLYPFVPYYRLRELHGLLQKEGLEMENSRGPVDFLRIVYESVSEGPGLPQAHIERAFAAKAAWRLREAYYQVRKLRRRKPVRQGLAENSARIFLKEAPPHIRLAALAGDDEHMTIAPPLR
jgi:fatty acid desaturase